MSNAVSTFLSDRSGRQCDEFNAWPDLSACMDFYRLARGELATLYQPANTAG